MIRRRSAHGLALRAALALSGVLFRAGAQPTPVHVQAPAEEQDVARRLSVELLAEDYDVREPSPGASSPCALDREAAALPRDVVLPSAWIALGRDPGTHELVAAICYASPAPAPLIERAVLRAPGDDPRRLALAAVEALNGLRAKPLRGSRAVAPVPPADTVATARRVPARAALFGSAVLVLPATGASPLVGSGFGLAAPITRALSWELEIFVPLRESEATGARRELSLGASWARFGPAIAWRLSPLRFGASLHAGAALIWASARSRDPSLVGTTELTGSALVAGGLWLETPEDSRFFVRAAAQASSLFPSIELVLGDGAVEEFGVLLFETALGAGVRF